MLKDRLWDQAEPALAEKKHKEYLARGILAAIPFGQPRVETPPTAIVQPKTAPVTVTKAAGGPSLEPPAATTGKEDPKPAAEPAAVVRPASVSGYVRDSASNPIVDADIVVEIARGRDQQ